MALEATSRSINDVCARSDPWPALCRAEWGIDVLTASSSVDARAAYRFACESWLQIRQRALGRLRVAGSLAGASAVLNLPTLS